MVASGHNGLFRSLGPPVSRTNHDVSPVKFPVSKRAASSCSAAAKSWDVSCTVTISGTDLPPGEQITLRDELMSAGSNIATNGAFDTGPFAGSNCAGGTINGGVGAACAVTTDDIISNGGSSTSLIQGRSMDRVGVNSLTLNTHKTVPMR